MNNPTRTILAAVLSLTAGVGPQAKKLYKYQDENGRWHYSDKAPKTVRQVEITQLRAEPKKRVWLEERGSGPRPEYYMINSYPGPIEAEVVFDGAENVVAEPPLPRRFVLQGTSTRFVFRLGPETPGLGWHAGLKLRVVPGDPSAEHRPDMPYLPPVAQGERFRISQGFNGAFSHRDPENKFAVDIAMPEGSAVRAARAGTVLAVDEDYFNSGVDVPENRSRANQIAILHSDGTMAVYAHLALERAQAYPGLAVEAGQLIGFSGNTGYSTAPHLHFVIQRNAGMRLESVPFLFLMPDGRRREPADGMWLEGIVR